MSSATASEQWTTDPKTSHEAYLEECPANCTCPNIAVKPKEHAKTEQAEAWLETKEGQDHLKICIPSCRYKLLKKRLDAEAKGEEVKEADAAAKAREDHLKICVPSCPYHKTNGDVLEGEASATAPDSSVVSIIQGASVTELPSPEPEMKCMRPTVEGVDDDGH